MKINRRIHAIKKSDAITVQIVEPEIIVHSGITELDKLLGGFKAGEMTLVDGNSEMISDLPNQLCVNTYRTFHSETIYIDGGMSADPYQIARYARMYELDQQEALANVKISRAFTVYQLSNILHDNLETIIESLHPQTLILGMFPALYHDPDVSSQEAQALFQRDLEKIKELTIKYNLITILTDHDTAIFPSNRGLGKILSSSINEIVRMKKHEQFTSVDLVKKQASATIVHFAKGQIRLEEFGMAV